MERFLIRKKGTEDSQEDHNCSSAKYNKLSSNDFSDEQGSQKSEDDTSDFSEDECDAHDESHHPRPHVSNSTFSTASTDNSDSLDKTDKCEASKKSTSNSIKKITRGPGRNYVRCDVCFRFPNTVKIFAPNGRVPNICSENGIIPRKTHIDNHVKSVVHKECVKADKLARLSSIELQASAPIDSQFIRSNKELANYVGNYIYTVYNDAKRGTLSAFSWLSRVVARNIGSEFDINTEFTNYEPNDLRYVNPVGHREFLSAIVSSEKGKLDDILQNSLAVSLRFDGSVDRNQIDNEHVLAKTVNQKGEENLYFLGFEEPSERGAEGALTAIQNAVEKSVKWDSLFPTVSSLASDGTNLNSGARSGIWARLNQMRQLQENGNDVPLLKMWCAVHRSALAWNSVCSSVAEVNYLIRDAAALATYFHSSGVRTRELQKVATENNLKVLRLPQYFEVRWSQYTSQLLRSILTSIRAILMYLKTSPDADAKGYLKNWLKKDRLHLSCFLMDVVMLYSRFQMKLQSDSVLVFDLVKERDKFLARLATAEEKPVIGGWEELFLSTIKVISHEGNESENDGEETENEWEFHGIKLETRTRRRRQHHLYVSDSRTIEAVRNEILLSLKNFLSERLQTDEWKDLAPLAQLRVDVSDDELRACHKVIIPDCDLFEFCQSYREAVATPSIQDEGPRSVLKQIVGMEEMNTLAIALARVIAAKPHSADVERLISRYNVLKSPARSRLNTDTLHYYIFIGFNLPPLASYDARPAVRYWLADKKRRAS